MRTSAAGLAALEREEGYRSKTYKDQAGLDTIGIGTLIDTAEERAAAADGFTREEAMLFLKKDLVKFENAINSLVKVPLSQNQFDALILLVYNIGVGAFSNSRLLKLINARAEKKQIEAAWKAWNKIRKNGVLVVSTGLTNRRAREFGLYDSGGVTAGKIVTALLIIAAMLFAAFFYLKTRK